MRSSCKLFGRVCLVQPWWIGNCWGFLRGPYLLRWFWKGKAALCIAQGKVLKGKWLLGLIHPSGERRHVCAAFPGSTKWTWKPPNIWLQLGFVCFRLFHTDDHPGESAGMDGASSRTAGEVWGAPAPAPALGWSFCWDGPSGMSSWHRGAAVLVTFDLIHLPCPTQGCVKGT